MRNFRFVPALIAAGIAMPFIGSTTAKAYSCGQLLVGMETAYNQFQAADNRGDEASMFKYYLAFETLVAQAEQQGCK